jgi:xanthine/CO dehydrogenase XdhC/CoxF family maturation factor
VPREAGTRMLVAADGAGTIGGGHLELQAIARARACWPAKPQPLEQHSRSARRWASAAAAR